MEFLGEFSFQVNKIFTSLIRYVEVQDIVTQFAHIQNRKLIGLSDLPQSVIASVLRHFDTIPDLSLTMKALQDGFPILINPITEYENKLAHLRLSTLLTVPRIASKNGLCTIESLVALTYKTDNRCFTGPLSRNDLVLVSCLDSKLVLKADILTTCFSEHNSLLCPRKLLRNADDVAWLGLPWTMDSKVNFKRNHVEVDCPKDIHPLHHLGGRYYLSVVKKTIQLTSTTLMLSPLTIFQLPCNETNNLLETGFGECPKAMTMSVPLFQKDNVQYVPWVPSTNRTGLDLHYESLKIGPRLVFNKTVITALDDTFQRIDATLHKKMNNLRTEIDAIQETQATSDALIVASTALVLALVNTIILISFCCIFKKFNQQQNDRLQNLVVQYRKEPVLECIECNEPLEDHKSDLDKVV